MLARQAEAFAEEEMAERFGQVHARLPDDLVNLQHDALACAVALGWDGVEVRDVPLASSLDGDDVQERVDHAGVPTRVVHVGRWGTLPAELARDGRRPLGRGQAKAQRALESTRKRP